MQICHDFFDCAKFDPQWGRGSGQVVSVLAFFSDDPSSNPAEVYSFIPQIVWKSEKNIKEAENYPFKRVEQQTHEATQTTAQKIAITTSHRSVGCGHKSL